MGDPEVVGLEDRDVDLHVADELDEIRLGAFEDNDDLEVTSRSTDGSLGVMRDDAENLLDSLNLAKVVDEVLGAAVDENAVGFNLHFGQR